MLTRKILFNCEKKEKTSLQRVPHDKFKELLAMSNTSVFPKGLVHHS